MASSLQGFWDAMLAELLSGQDGTEVQAEVANIGGDHPNLDDPFQDDPPWPNVPQDTLRDLLSPLTGQVQTTNLAPVVRAVLHQSQITKEKEAVHKMVEKVSRFYLEAGRTPHCSKAAMALMLEVPVKTIEPTLITIVNGLLHFEKWQCSILEKACCTGQLKPLLYIDSNRFDETPIRVRVKEVLSNPLTGHFPDIGAATPGDAPKSVLDAAMSQFFTQTTAVCKLLAVDNKFTLLLKKENYGSEAAASFADKYVAIQGPSLCHLQCLERAIGATMLQGFLENLGVSKHVQDVPMKIRSTCTDQAGSNKVAEDALRSRLGPGWLGLHHPCNVHKVARALQKSTEVVKEHVTGLLRFALGLETASAMSQFCTALSRVIADRELVVIPGHPPPAVQAYQDFCLNLFGKTGAKQNTKQYLIRTLVNGDWRRKDCLELYVPPGHVYDLQEPKLNVTKDLLVALTSKVFSKYPRHRWLGCDVATDEVGLLECIHVLRSAALAAMQLHAGRAEAERDAATVATAPGDLATDPVEDFAGEPAANEPINEAGPSDHMQLRPSDISAKNARYQRQALQWFSGDPLGSVVLLRMCLQPMTSLLTDYLTRSGQQWNQGQRAEASKQPQAGEGDPVPLSAFREYLLLSSEHAFFDSLQELRLSEDWQHLPSSCRTIRFQGKAFKMLSKMGGLVHQLLCVPARLSPCKLLGHAVGVVSMDEVLSTPECMMDPFTKDFLAKWPGQQLASDDAKACLHMLVEASHCDTVQVEWGHGRVNRLISVQSTHTRPPSLEFVNAQFIAQKHLQRCAQFSTHKKPSTRVPAAPADTLPDLSAEQPAKKSKKGRGGGGGAWRAFLSQRTRGTRGAVDWATMKDEYRQHRQENTPAFQEWSKAGKAATVKHQLSRKPSFGPPPRSVRRKIATNFPPMASQTARLQPPLPAPDAPETGEEHNLQVRFRLAAELTQVRRLALAEARARRERKKQLQDALAEFVDNHTGAAVEAVAVEVPGLQDFKHQLRLLPSLRGPQTLEIHLATHLDSTKQIASWATEHTRNSNLGRFLAAEWTVKNRPLLHAGDLPPHDQRTESSPCLTDGYCSCQEDTRGLRHLRRRFHQILKQAAQRLTISKEQMQQGDVCLKLMPEDSRMVDEEWAFLFDGIVNEQETEKQIPTDTPTWLHLCVQYLSPFRSTFQILQEVPSDREDAICLEQTGVFKAEGELFQDIFQECSWSAQLFLIVDTPAPLPHLRPRFCYISRR